MSSDIVKVLVIRAGNFAVNTIKDYKSKRLAQRIEAIQRRTENFFQQALKPRIVLINYNKLGIVSHETMGQVQGRL